MDGVRFANEFDMIPQSLQTLTPLNLLKVVVFYLVTGLVTQPWRPKGLHQMTQRLGALSVRRSNLSQYGWELCPPLKKWT